MTLNIVESIVGQLSTDQVAAISKMTGREPANARGVVSSGVVAIVGHLVERGSTATGANNLLTTFRSAVPTSNVASALIGDDGGDLTDTVARSTGISPAAAERVISMLLPLVAGIVRREVITKGLDAAGLVSALRSARGAPDVRPIAVPRHDVRVDVTPIRDVKRDAQIREVPISDAPIAMAPLDADRRRPSGWLTAGVILGALGVFGLILWARGRIETRAIDSASDTTVTAAEVAKTEDLPGHFARGDVPDAIPLADIQFAPGTTRLTGGVGTIDELATLMKQHPTARIRIEGNTESVRHPKAIDVLSVNRALAVKHLLVERGIDALRIEATGRTNAKSGAKDETSEGRANGRRIDAVIIQR